MGITLNIVVLFGLILAVGILVDGGIVVVEYAERLISRGEAPPQAYVAAAHRMFWPVVNGTLAILSAFLPFLFWNSVVGRFMSFLPLTLFLVLGVSLLVVLFLTPALGATLSRGRPTAAAAPEPAAVAAPSPFMHGYTVVVAAMVRHPTRVTVATLGILIVIFAGFAAHSHRVEFFVEEDPEYLEIIVREPGNLSPEAQMALTASIADRFAGIAGIRSLFVRAGVVTGAGAPRDAIGRISIDFDEFDRRRELGLRGADIEAAVRNRLRNTPGLQVEVRSPQSGLPLGKDIQIELLGHDPVTIDHAADKVLAHLRQDAGLIVVEDGRAVPGMEWNLDLDRTAAGRAGVDVLTLGRTVQFLTGGVLVGRYRPDDSDDEIDIRVRFSEAFRRTDAVAGLRVATSTGLAPASGFVRLVASKQVTTIARRDGQRLLLLQANARPGTSPNDKVATLRAWLPTAGLDPGVRWRFAGADKQSREAIVFFLLAMLATLTMMSVILLMQFNSFYGVLVTLSAVAMSIGGVLLGIQLNLLGAFDYISVVFVGTGAVALAGVVVGHNIVLVDTF